MFDLPELIARVEALEGPDEESTFTTSNERLFKMLPRDQIDRVFSSEMCDISSEFLGFVDIYDRLAQIIPLGWRVIDLGCAYAAQAFFFISHAEYIGVDLLTPVEARFSTHNSRHETMTISDFIVGHAASFDPQTTFAICSYVPPWHGDNQGMVRRAFQNVFTFYPASASKVCPAAALKARASE